MSNELGRIAVDVIAEGRLPPEAVRPGVKALDVWSEGVFGAVLFWVDTHAAQNTLRAPQLGATIVSCADGPWRSLGSGMATEKPWEVLLASVPAGLTRYDAVTSGVRDRRGASRKVCLTWATAGRGVALVRIRDEDGNVRDRLPGRYGFVLLGVTPEDPLTRVCGIGPNGQALAGESITLWCPGQDTAATG